MISYLHVGEVTVLWEILDWPTYTKLNAKYKSTGSDF